MKPAQIILKLEEIADVILTRHEQAIMIDIARRNKSASLLIDNWKLFVVNEKSKNVEEFAEWFAEMVEKPEQFPLMPWDSKNAVEPDVF
jgi:hypothetical protein